MSPEQLAGQPASVASDVYALGLVLYEMFTGARAFEAPTLDAWRRVHTESRPSSPSTHVAEMDTAVERVILRCLEKDPASRPRSASQVALVDFPEATRSPSQWPKERPPRPRWSRPRVAGGRAVAAPCVDTADRRLARPRGHGRRDAVLDRPRPGADDQEPGRVARPRAGHRAAVRLRHAPRSTTRGGSSATTACSDGWPITCPRSTDVDGFAGVGAPVLLRLPPIADVGLRPLHFARGDPARRAARAQRLRRHPQSSSTGAGRLRRFVAAPAAWARAAARTPRGRVASQPPASSSRASPRSCRSSRRPVAFDARREWAGHAQRPARTAAAREPRVVRGAGRLCRRDRAVAAVG